MASCVNPIEKIGEVVPDRLEATSQQSLALTSDRLRVHALTLDAQDRIYLGGDFGSTLAIDNIAVAPAPEAGSTWSIVALTQEGTFRWGLSFPENVVEIVDLQIHPDGTLVVASNISAPISLAGGTWGQAGGAGVMFYVSQDGVVDSARSLNACAGPFAIAPDGDILASTSSLQNCSGGQPPSFAEATASVIRFTIDGTFRWSLPLPLFPTELTVADNSRWYLSTVANSTLFFSDRTVPIAFNPTASVLVAFSDTDSLWVEQWEPGDLDSQIDAHAQGVELLARFRGSFGSGAQEISAPPDPVGVMGGAHVAARFEPDGSLSSTEVLAASRDEFFFELKRNAAEDLLAIGSFRGTFDFGDGWVLSSGASNRQNVVVVSRDAQGSTKWALRLGELAEGSVDDPTLELANDGSILALFHEHAPDRIALHWLDEGPVANDSLAWQDGCNKLYKQNEIANATILERPEEGASSNELQPVIVGECYNVQAGTLVRVFDEANCTTSIASAVTQDGAFRAEVGPFSIPWQGSADGPIDFYARVESPQGATLVECALLESGYTLDSGQWRALNSSDEPGGRTRHTALWTGTEMIIWGGEDGSAPLDDGARYDPSLDTWTPMATDSDAFARTDHMSVWTGTQMIIWGGDANGSADGGRVNQGVIYDLGDGSLGDDSWSKISLAPATLGRVAEGMAVWSGTEMIIWGGERLEGVRDVGAHYDPLTNDWTLMQDEALTPSARKNAAVVWTGSEMIIWGGLGESDYLNDGARYDPSAPVGMRWRALNVPASLPALSDAAMVWDGTWLWFIGNGSGASGGFAGRFDLATDTWQEIDNLVAHTLTRAVFANDTLYTFGRCQLGTEDIGPGGIYEADFDRWRLLPSVGGPGTRCRNSLIWTGSEMIVWGGTNVVGAEQEGGFAYQP